QLPAMENVLAPELARRRGLELTVTRIGALPSAEMLFHALYGGSSNAVWLDSSITETAALAETGSFASAAASATPADWNPQAARSRFSIMADDAGCFGQLASHNDGVTTVTAGQLTTRIRGPFFRWLDSVWGRKAVRAPDHYPGDFTLGWLGYLGYELKGETGGSGKTATS